MIDIGRLIHFNGPPGVGKSSLARRYLEDHPLALMVDIDDLRTHLGQWATHEESRLLARDLALALVECHLGAGHEVVVPQFLGRLAFIEKLEATAARCGPGITRCPTGTSGPRGLATPSAVTDRNCSRQALAGVDSVRPLPLLPRSGSVQPVTAQPGVESAGRRGVVAYTATMSTRCSIPKRSVALRV